MSAGGDRSVAQPEQMHGIRRKPPVRHPAGPVESPIQLGLIALQRAAGNAAVTRLLRDDSLQYRGEVFPMPIRSTVQCCGSTPCYCSEEAKNHAVQAQSPLSVQRQRPSPKPAPLDATAEQIVSRAVNPKSDLKRRGVRLIYDILNQYYAGYASKVSSVGFDDAKAPSGLQVETTWDRNTKTYYGTIWVGTSYITDLINDKFNFAHKVLQVQHELEHIDQIRSGMGGDDRKDEREFLAHAHEALAAEKAGTGKMKHSTRVQHIDAAVGHFFCLDKKLTTKNDPFSNNAYEELKDELLTQRPPHAKFLQSPTPPPSTCTRV